MISVQQQIYQLLIGIFLGAYLSIAYHYFNNFYSCKKSLLKKNIYDFIFIIFNLLLLISFLEENSHGIIRFYPVLLFVITFCLLQIFIVDKFNKDFIKIYLLYTLIKKYFKKLLKHLIVSKTILMVIEKIIMLAHWFKKSTSRFKNRDKTDTPI